MRLWHSRDHRGRAPASLLLSLSCPVVAGSRSDRSPGRELDPQLAPTAGPELTAWLVYGVGRAGGVSQ
jgi:hypothetical protein